jgi:hypothetical protein
MVRLSSASDLSLRSRFVTHVLITAGPGVLWRSEELVEGVDKALALFRKRGKKLAFVTNVSLYLRKLTPFPKLVC